MEEIVRYVLKIAVILFFPLIAALIVYAAMYSKFLAPADSTRTTVESFEVPNGMNFSAISDQLQQKGLIRSAWALGVSARLKGIDTTKISAGEYEFSASMKPSQILAKLANREVVIRSVLVREGANIFQIADEVEKSGLLSKDEFIKTVTDPSLVQKAGIFDTTQKAAPSFEGYLFPNTYKFSRPITAEKIVWTMLEEGEKQENWSKEFTEQAEKVSLSRFEVITLASIIEKESGNVDEQPIISSVFHNRLRAGIQLQSDPTVIYGIPNFNGNLTRADLETPTAYNTYKRFGLPIGPISNPGRTAIKAALYPSDTSYLYFVGDGKGRHIFSTTLAEHNAAVAQFQKAPALAAAAAAANPAAGAPPGATPAAAATVIAQ